MDAIFTVLSAFGAAGAVVTGLLVGGIVWGVGSSSGWWGKKKNKALNAPEKKSYAYLEEDKATQESVSQIVRGYVDDGALGMQAQAVLSTFENANLRKKGIYSLLEQEFEQGTMSWDKFSVPVDTALEGIVKNAAQIANRMQAFDSAEYLRMYRIDEAGGYDDESMEVQRLAVMKRTLKEMKDIQNDNDRLIVELEKLQAELTKLATAGYDTQTDQIVAEINQLTEDTKYYS